VCASHMALQELQVPLMYARPGLSLILDSNQAMLPYALEVSWAAHLAPPVKLQLHTVCC
jgi:hypothetical protein